jgi:hypothetical protein
MRPRSLVVLLLVCGCGASTSSPAPVVIPVAEPATTAAAPSAAPSSSAAAIAEELAKLDVAMIGALNSSRDPAKPGDVPTALLGGDPSAGRGGLAGLRLGAGGGGTLQPGSAAGGGLAGIGSSPGAGAAGSAVKVKGPIGKATVGSIVVKGSVSNAVVVAAGMAAGFRRCFNKGLQDDPTMRGSLVITATLGPQGEVLSASPSGGGLSGSVIACVATRVSSAQFAPPDGGAATVTIPVKFEADNP